MSVLDYIKPVPTITAEEFRRRFGGQKTENYSLVDVRQPKEYEAGHIPGAVLAPLGELHASLDTFNRQKPVIVYCAIGGRSSAGASVFLNAGFNEVYSLEGGFRAWEGPQAAGGPEFGTPYFRGTGDPLLFLSLSWALEENTIRFYKAVLARFQEMKIRDILSSLISVEEDHKEMILSMYNKIKGQSRTADYPDCYSGVDDIDAVLEGGLRLSQVLEWSRGKSIQEILEHAIAQEALLYDIYTKILGSTGSAEMKPVITRLANEEKQHLNRFIRYLEEFL